jgi:hypothetical protein
MIAVGDQTEHLFVHADELVLGQRLLILSVNQCFGDLLLEVAGLHRIDHLYDD